MLFLARQCNSPKGARGFGLYSVKDVQMAKDASYGLMIWDGKSRGTLENVRSLLAQGKPVAVHFGPARRFVGLRSAADLHKIGVAIDTGPDIQHGLPLVTAERAEEAGVLYHHRSHSKRRRSSSTRSRG